MAKIVVIKEERTTGLGVEAATDKDIMIKLLYDKVGKLNDILSKPHAFQAQLVLHTPVVTHMHIHTIDKVVDIHINNNHYKEINAVLVHANHVLV